MKTFVSIVEGKSLSKAARAERLSLPAVSRQLNALERELGASLIVRSTRRLHVTDAGQRWYEHCKLVLRSVDDARASVSGSNAVSGRLVVSASLTFGSSVIVPRLAALAERHPKLSIDLRLEDQLVDLVGEGVDVAVRAGPAPPDSTAFVAHPIFDMARILVASPRFVRARGSVRRPEELSQRECLIQVTLGGHLIPWVLRASDTGETVTPDVRGRLRTNAPNALLALALAGAGVAYLPEWVASAAVASGALKRLLPKWASPRVTAWAIHRAELRGAPRLRAFLDILPQDSAAIEDLPLPTSSRTRRTPPDSPNS